MRSALFGLALAPGAACTYPFSARGGCASLLAMAAPTDTAASDVSLHAEPKPDGALELAIGGRLDADTAGGAWREAMAALDAAKPRRFVVDASALEYCDGSGAALLLRLQRRQEAAGGEFELRGLREEFGKLIELYGEAKGTEEPGEKPKAANVPEEVGRFAVGFALDMRNQVAFIGELTVALALAAARPRRVRWREAALTAERAGVDGLVIVAMIAFLLGLITSFQAAIPMKRFAAEIFVADLISISMVRELGALVTAIVMAGRTGSAFAAEIGTMKVREEIDALTTMGLDPVRFLVVPRVIGAVLMTPLLSLFAIVAGLAGGAIVVLSLGYPMVTFVNRAIDAASIGDLVGGLFKSVVFGALVAGVGCLRGLQAGSGASAVGEAATRAVVSGITLVVVADGLFAVIFYVLGI